MHMQLPPSRCMQACVHTLRPAKRLSSCAMLLRTSGRFRATAKLPGSMPIGKAATRVSIPLSSTPSGVPYMVPNHGMVRICLAQQIIPTSTCLHLLQHNLQASDTRALPLMATITCRALHQHRVVQWQWIREQQGNCCSVSQSFQLKYGARLASRPKMRVQAETKCRA